MTDPEFTDFYQETAAPLHAYISRVCADASLADDLLQASFIRLLRAKSLPEHSVARRVYLFRTATNLMRDHFRRGAAELRRAKQLASVGEVAAPGGGVNRAETGAAGEVEMSIDVRGAFNSLRSRDRELLWLAHVVEMTHREIGEVAGVGERSVRVLLQRARKRFASVLAEHGIGPDALA